MPRNASLITFWFMLIPLAGCDHISPEADSSYRSKQTMDEPFIPPVMPAYPTSYDELVKIMAPYYREQRPLDLFFELYIADVLGQLPEATSQTIDAFSNKHTTFFGEHVDDWRMYVVHSLHLSDTIDVAIWDLWIKNSAISRSQGWECHPWYFAQLFSEQYFADNSRIDVWEGIAFEEAKQRIKAHRGSILN